MMKLIKTIFSRAVITIFLIGVQFILFVLFWVFLSRYSNLVTVLLNLVSLIIVFYIIMNKDNQSYKIPWIVLVMLIPLLGGLLYLLFGTKRPKGKMIKRLENEHERIKEYYKPNLKIQEEIAKQDLARAGLFSYLQKICKYPAWGNTQTIYYPLGEIMYEDMLAELKKAEKFIFLEYFIIEKGIMWDGIYEILKAKAAQGIDVRVMYDDLGSLMLLPRNFPKELEAAGIKCLKFNPFVPLLSLAMNNRDHRKILVIDGKVAFNGGINIADEYINKRVVRGHWKDTGVKLLGPAVNGFTTMFLEMWNAFRRTEEDYSGFMVDHSSNDQAFPGYVLPFSDSPIDDESVGQNVYINILNQSKKYVYIFSPYLIIDDEMKNALCLAAKRGVDVKLITPGIGDKKIVHNTTRSYYPLLIESGVKIYEYTPGFCHAKSYVSDDEIGLVGTINMDFRSLYLHFECGTLMYKTQGVMDLKEDFLTTLEKCQEIEYNTFRRAYARNAVIRLLAPLM